MTPKQRHCIPCHKATKAIAEKDARELVKELPGWRVSKCGKWLRKSYTFPDFAQALAFTNRIGAQAEAEGHHPDLKLGWGYVDVSLQTHNIGGLHQNDFVLAEKIEKIQ